MKRDEHPFSDKQGYVFEHRLVAEKHLLTDENSVEINGNRYLKREYEVHHINFDRLDNRVENLMVLTKSEHRKLHNALNPQKKDCKTGRFLKNSELVKIKKIKETAKLPTKSSDGSAGFDIYLDEEVTQYLAPGKTHIFHTNIALEIPKGYFGAIFARSGLSSKHGIRPATCVSVIDSDYRGEIGVPLHNDNKEESYKIEPNERVAQLVILPIPEVELVETDTLEETERGNGGFWNSGR